MRFWGLLLFVVPLSLTSCSTRGVQDGTFDVPVLDKDRQAFLQNFPLLDERGEMRPPVVGSTQTWPLGALIYMPPSGRGGFCSVSHVSPGKVAANAHCVEQDRAPYNYFVAYYDRAGKKTYDRVKTIDYIGKSSSDDVAILAMTDTDERRWHVLNAKFIPTQRTVGAVPPAAMKVSIWAFNPTPENHPDLYIKYRLPGMKFEPRHCLVSRSAPQVIGIKGEGESATRIPIQSSAREWLHLFVDDCDKKMVHGNSGSLISEDSNSTRVLGVYHWIVQPDDRGYSSIDYRGNAGVVRNRTLAEVAENGMFGVGTAFEAAFERKPSLLNFFQDWSFELLPNLIH
jgi:hypothetical protein